MKAAPSPSVWNSSWEAAASMDDRRDQIMQSLGEMVRDRQISSLTMQEIADHLGMTKGNLYHYFAGKQDLLLRCHVKAMEDSLRLLDVAERSAGTSTERLHVLLRALVISVIADPYGAVLALKLDTLSAANRAHYIALRDRFERGVRSLMAAGCAEGDLVVEDVKIATFAVLGAINAIPVWYRTDGARDPESIASSYADILLGGLRARC